MTKWAWRRRLIITSAFSALIFFLGLVVWFVWLMPEPPTPVEVIRDPLVVWARAIETVPGVYNAVAYASSVGTRHWSDRAEFQFDFYDSTGTRIGSYREVTAVPPNKIFRVFAPRVPLPTEPELVTLSWQRIDWSSREKLIPELTAGDITLSGAETSPRVTANVTSQNFFSVEAVEVVAEVYDPEDNNLLGISRTVISSLAPSASSRVVFTWPGPFPVSRDRRGSVLTESGELDVVLILDRSGSMAADGFPERGLALPLQPMNAVLQAAGRFVDQVRDSDQLAVISFATEASDPADAELSLDHRQVRSAIAEIEPMLAEKMLQETQFTNIGDAFRLARQQLQLNGRDEAHSVIIFLTDGEEPNRPLSPGNDNYPVTFALEHINLLKSDGVEIFTIGLGDQFDGSFLIEVASSPEHYSQAPTVDFLDQVYQRIAEEIKATPLGVRVTPRALRY